MAKHMDSQNNAITLSQEPPISPRKAYLAEKKLHAISELSQLNTATTNRSELIREITTRLANQVGCERVMLWRVEEIMPPQKKGNPHQVLALQCPLGEHEEKLQVQLEQNQGLVAWVAQHNRVVNLKDITKDPRYRPLQDNVDAILPKSAIYLPLLSPSVKPSPALHGGIQDDLIATELGVIGVIQAINKFDAYFSPDDQDFLYACTQQAALLLRQQRLYSNLVTQNYELLDLEFRLQDRQEEVELMLDIEHAAAVAHNLDEALEGALIRTHEQFPCEFISIILLEREDSRSSFRVRKSIGPKAHLFPPQIIGLDPFLIRSGVHAEAITSSEWDHSPEVQALFSPLLGRLQIEHFAAIPIQRPEEPPLGLLFLANPLYVPKGFDDRDQHRLQLIASRIAQSVVLAQAMEEERKAERLAAIGGALSGLLHDIRTPLTLMNAYVQLMETENTPEKRQELRTNHKNQSAHIQAIIKETLAFSKGERETLMRKIWVRELFEDIQNTLSLPVISASSSPPIQVLYELQYTGAIKADENKLKRALYNLAKNAREAMADTGGTLSFCVKKEGEQVLIEVSDTGPGIPKEIEGRLFQSFSTHGKQGGTGLGLAIVKTIVDQHQGTLDVRSSKHGTTFTITLQAA